MRTLEDLKAALNAIPCPFADEASDAVSEFNNTTAATTNYNEGFPAAYSKDPNASGDAKGKYLLRNDMNAFGQMATKELFFKEAGGVHTYDAAVASKFEGYPEKAVLGAYDGEYLALVESQVLGNVRKFVDDNGLTDYGVVNCEVANSDASDSDDGKPKSVLWKTANWISGLDDSLFHIEVNYSALHKIEDGDIIEQDSLVIGTAALFLSKPKQEDVVIWPISAANPIKHKTLISAPGQATKEIEITNKGKCGDALGSIIYINDTSLAFHYIPVCSFTGGTGNYFLAAFAKANTTFSTTLYGGETRYGGTWDETDGTVDYFELDVKPYWFAIPIEIRVGA